MVSIRTFVIMILDSRGDKVCENLDHCRDCSICSSHGDRMRLRFRCDLSVWKGSCLNVFDGESGDRLVIQFPAPKARSVSQA